MRRIALVLSVLALSAAASATATASPDREVEPAGTGTAIRSDFNGDGFSDLAATSPTEDVGSIFNAGAVNVVYGSAAGLVATGDQYWTQDSTDILDEAESGDGFGTALAGGDFNRDGYDDLAVGVGAETIGTALTNAGGVNVIYGSATGLTSAGNQFWTQNSSGIVDDSEPGDRFGASLAVGDFDRDGYDDIAIGVPGQLVGSTEVEGGAVSVIYGGQNGLASAGNRMLTQDSEGILDFAEDGDRFGITLATGDFDGDGYDDLAAAARTEDVGSTIGAGGVNVVYGSPNGLDTAGNQFWTQDSSGILDDAERGDRFGGGLASGDFNGDSFDDLAVGVPAEDLGSLRNAGAVNVIYGEAVNGLMSVGSQLWTQDSDLVGDVAETSDVFGSPLAAADFNANGYDDLAIGVTGEDVGVVSNAGATNVLYGSVDELTSSGNQFWSQDAGLEDVSEEGDAFSTAMGVADFNNDTYDDLAVGVPSEDLGSILDAGVVNVVYGASFGLTSGGNELWSQDSTGIQDVAETGDAFGGTVA